MNDRRKAISCQQNKSEKKNYLSSFNLKENGHIMRNKINNVFAFVCVCICDNDLCQIKHSNFANISV